jgi:hypothetical protein
MTVVLLQQRTTIELFWSYVNIWPSEAKIRDERTQCEMFLENIYLNEIYNFNITGNKCLLATVLLWQ